MDARFRNITHHPVYPGNEANVDGWLRLMGLRPEDVVDHQWTRYLHPDDAGQLMNRALTHLATGRIPHVLIGTARLLMPHGTYAPVRSTIRPVYNAQGAVELWVGDSRLMTRDDDAP